MNALISGQAAVAVLIDGDSLSSFTRDDPETLVPRRPSDLHLLLGTATDVVEVEDTSHREAIKALGKSWSRDRAVRMALIFLDLESERKTRLDAAECLDEFLVDAEVAEYATNLLTTAPLPLSSPGMLISQAELLGLGRVVALIRALVSLQHAIRTVRLAWDALPPDLFISAADTTDPSEARRRLETDVARAGVFRSLAEAGEDAARVNAVLASCLVDPDLAGRPVASTLRRWVDSLLEQIATRPPGPPTSTARMDVLWTPGGPPGSLLGTPRKLGPLPRKSHLKAKDEYGGAS